MPNQFLPFAYDPAADVMLHADYAAAGFVPRHLGFATGTALSIQLNTVWRQASLITSMIGEFVWDETGLNMMDDGSPANMTALQANFTAAIRTVARQVSQGYLPLAGGTLTGALTMNAAVLTMNAPAASDGQLAMRRGAGHSTTISGDTNASARWQIVVANADPETGANVGSNFAIERFSDAGARLDTTQATMSINRQTGVVNFAHAPTVNHGTLPYLPLAGGTLGGELVVGGRGIGYTAHGANHRFGFSWDNTYLHPWVDGADIGQLATVAWVNAHLGAQGGPFLPIAGGTITGSLTVNGVLHGTTALIAGTVGIGGNGVSYTAHSATNYFGLSWDNTFLHGWVNGVDHGQLATVAWVNTQHGGAYLPLTGGTVTNFIILDGTLAVSGTAQFKGTTLFGNQTDFSLYTSGNSRVLQWKANYGYLFDHSSNWHTWLCNTKSATLSPTADLYVDGTIRASGARIIATHATVAPSVSAWNQAASLCNGFWTGSDGLWFGSLDGNGNPLASGGNMRIDDGGALWVKASILAGAGGINTTGSMYATLNVSMGGDLGVTGNAYVTGNLGVTGTIYGTVLGLSGNAQIDGILKLADDGTHVGGRAVAFSDSNPSWSMWSNNQSFGMGTWINANNLYLGYFDSTGNPLPPAQSIMLAITTGAVVSTQPFHAPNVTTLREAGLTDEDIAKAGALFEHEALDGTFIDPMLLIADLYKRIKALEARDGHV